MDPPQKVTLNTTHCGEVNVFIVGDQHNINSKVVFLAVHDFGSNAQSFDRFIAHESMTEIRPRSLWLNFEVPGQGLNAPDLPADYKFPSLQEIGEDLVEVLNQLHVQYVIGLGEGAGANILTRFAITYPTRVLGLILDHPTATSAGWGEWVKDKFLGWKGRRPSVTPSTEDYLVTYKFGTADNRDFIIQQYLADLRSKVNAKNLQLYMEAFLNRSDLTNLLKDRLSCDALIVCGTKSSFLHTVLNMYSHMNSQKASLLKIDGVGEALNEAPEQVTRGLLLFCKGLGLLTSVSTPADRARISNATDLPGVPRRRMSMQEADVPRRISVSRPPGS